LEVGSGEIQAPDVQVLDVADLPRYLALPRQFERRPLIWNTRGLQAVPQPDLPWAVSSSVDAYRVMGAHMQATLVAVRHIEGPPRVSLADYRYRWFADRKFQGWAAFDVEPAGAAMITLNMPQGASLLHATVGGVVVAPQPTGDGNWRLPIHLTHLPQRIEVVFQGSLVPSRDRSNLVSLLPPTLAEAPSELSLWTIQGPDDWKGEAVLAHTRTDELTQTRTRLESARSLWNSATGNVPRESAGDSRTWSAGWLEWIGQLEQDVMTAERRLIDRDAPSLSSHWGSRYDVDGVWCLPETTTAHLTHYLVRGPSMPFDLFYQPWPWSAAAWRFGSAILLLGILIGTRRAYQMRWLRSTLDRYPQLLVGLAGVVWWLWLTPSWLGLAVLVVVVVSSIRDR
jgi:hypothetical protein